MEECEIDECDNGWLREWKSLGVVVFSGTLNASFLFFGLTRELNAGELGMAKGAGESTGELSEANVAVGVVGWPKACVSSPV